MVKSRVGIITFNRAINYGAVMQTYALQYVISKELGCICDVIDYRSMALEKEYETIPIKKMLHPRTLGSILLTNSYIRFNRQGFENFCTKHITFSEKTCYSREDLNAIEDEYDLFITGSDQVFNVYCSHYDTAYFLDFLKNKSKKNSYAASMGLNKIPDSMVEMYKDLLKDFNSLSVREETAANEIKIVTGRQCDVNIDPTLLIREKWIDLANFERVPDYSYVLVYSITEDKALFSIAKQTAHERNCKVLYVSDRLFNWTGAVRLKNVNPDEWLGLILNASAVITNSYHGILFSCNFHKDFYVVLLDKNQQVNSRITDFLRHYHLEKTLVDLNDTEKNHINFYKVDYDSFDIQLDYDKNKSYNFLKKLVTKAAKREESD